ncbi:MAG: fdhD [Caloramator sp.]|jgi:FdhD protein|uniref:formate dehydrogenase accessory sulfurtransferase FdhD n=1 Tax=Caloramator sp. TaxID=1871330 RepID=UPI001DCF9E84|nr:formate dehydrogenase accessory sulfurtransferase FdhD [Caloramator sp.]MBZ4664046.1 fdhD [Caloramator sp.]
MDVISYKKICVFKDGEKIEKDDSIIVERPINLYINNYYFTTLMCLPQDLKELSVGFIKTDGVIETFNEIDNISVLDEGVYINLVDKNREIKRKESALTSGCGRGSVHISLMRSENLKKVESDKKFLSGDILSNVNKFNKESSLFLETGGVHSAALCGNNIIVRMDDIGRHNAIDKVIGYGLEKGIEFYDKYIITSGRISSDMVIKASRINLPLIVSHSAPTSLAVDLAKMCNITLIGFVRGNRLNVYTMFERIV